MKNSKKLFVPRHSDLTSRLLLQNLEAIPVNLSLTRVLKKESFRLKNLSYSSKLRKLCPLSNSRHLAVFSLAWLQQLTFQNLTHSLISARIFWVKRIATSTCSLESWLISNLSRLNRSTNLFNL